MSAETQLWFPCKTPNCDQHVIYQPTAVSGVAYDQPPGLDGKPTTVYLTCANQHTHAYTVTRRWPSRRRWRTWSSTTATGWAAAETWSPPASAGVTKPLAGWRARSAGFGPSTPPPRWSAPP
jgi:hypothetical protein